MLSARTAADAACSINFRQQRNRPLNPEKVRDQLGELREEYRQAMNKAAAEAQRFASEDEMDRVSEFSTESERKREAFVALNRAIKIVDAAQ